MITTSKARSHRRVYTACGRYVSIANVNGVVHIEWGDIAAVIPKFFIPTLGVVQTTMIAGRAFISTYDLEEWAKSFEKKAMPERARTLRSLIDWAVKEARSFADE